ncbi:MAG: glycosyltransferase [Rhodoferax sp.]|nr:glycosyltransferase [Rhodoferax sp.]MDP3651352.1 glycosyltransferase [Rhodoferax sp.]
MNSAPIPIFSVIIPTYNHGHFIGRSLQSLLDQTLVSWEAIIIDNHSQDNTDEVIAKFADPRITLLKIHNHGVIAASRNMGIRAAKGEWIAFLDSDDWWVPRKLELSFAVIDSRVDFVYHDLFIARNREQIFFSERIVSTKPRRPMFSAFLCSGMSVPNSSVVIRRDLLDRIGGESEKQDLISVEDLDTWVRVARITERFVRHPECLGYYWLGGGNLSAASLMQITRISALYEQYFGELNSVELRHSKGFLAYRIGRIAQLCDERETASKNFFLALRNSNNLLFRAKALYFLALNLLSRPFS